MTALPVIPGKSWSRIVARAWADDAFRDRLLSDPKSVLREHGIETAGDVRVSTAERDGDFDEDEPLHADETLHLILPPLPSDLSEEDLVPTGAAYCGCGGCHRCGRCGCGCGGCGGCGICRLCS
jgi:hypothetical protein